MASTRKSTPAHAAQTALILALSASLANAALSEMTYQGCYSSSQPLKSQGSWTYQTSGYCQPICVKQNQAVLGLSEGSDCWCGGQLPSADSLVDDSKCNEPCNGYDQEYCGGDGFFSVYLTGLEDDVSNFGGSSGGSNSGGGKPLPDHSSPTTSSPPTVVTEVSPGKTIVITKSASPAASASSTATSDSSSSGGSTNVAGIAAGVVVGVVAAIALFTALFFWIRSRKRRAAEEEYKKNQVADFMRGGDKRPPQTGWSMSSDSRLDPEAGARRDSHGSIADGQDYSRRILRVANPDRSSMR